MGTGEAMLRLKREVPLTAVAMAPSRPVVVVGAADGGVCLWNLETKAIVVAGAGHVDRCAGEARGCERGRGKALF